MQPQGFATWLLVGVLAVAAAAFFMVVRTNPALVALPDWSGGTGAGTY